MLQQVDKGIIKKIQSKYFKNELKILNGNTEESKESRNSLYHGFTKGLVPSWRYDIK